ncbi:MAG: ROK family protein [Firmicutes bacterium]|nr:ROK family protein [Bacillota bacterium]
MGRLYGGIDLGGTKIESVVCDGEGVVLGRERRPTPVGSADALLAALAESLEAACARAGVRPSELEAAGLGAPGPLDAEAGLLLEPPNLGGLRDLPLAEPLARRLGVPCFLENDANAAAVGEFTFGAGRGVRDGVYITLSTGIGGGLVLDGRLYRGAAGTAGEIGHMIVQPDGPLCGCGRRGCWEALASGLALARQARQALAGLAAGPARDWWLERLEGRLEAVTAADVFAAEAQGVPPGPELVAQEAAWVGLGMANLIQLLAPRRIVVGGGLSRAGERLLGPARAKALELAFASATRNLEIVQAALEAPGAVGAAAVAMRRLRGEG